MERQAAGRPERRLERRTVGPPMERQTAGQPDHRLERRLERRTSGDAFVETHADSKGNVAVIVGQFPAE